MCKKETDLKAETKAKLPAPTSECLQLKTQTNKQTNKQTRSTAPGAAPGGGGGGGGGGGEAAATEKREGVGCLFACLLALV
jgi:hypothetical protein